MCLLWLHWARKQEPIRQIIKEPLDFLYLGHLCDRRPFEERFIFLHATESQVTEFVFSSPRICQKWENSQELDSKESEKEKFCLPRQKINYKIRLCYQNCLYLCLRNLPSSESNRWSSQSLTATTVFNLFGN